MAIGAVRCLLGRVGMRRSSSLAMGNGTCHGLDFIGHNVMKLYKVIFRSPLLSICKKEHLTYV
jgi:hypothetical protein